MADESYNGWRNYETWLLKLNLDNDYGTYQMCQSWFKNKKKHPSDEEMGLMVEQFKEMIEQQFFVEEYNIYYISDSWTHRDWQEIDWYEIVEAFLEEKEK
jgi:hypothetical protein